jgi:hypothetical protein
LLPAAAIASASASNWRWPAISAWSRKPAFIPFPSYVSDKIEGALIETRYTAHRERINADARII